MRTHRFVTDPVTGRMRTEEGVSTVIAQANLERARRECRDVISGNVQFHDDPHAAPVAAVPAAEVLPVQVLIRRAQLDLDSDLLKAEQRLMEYLKKEWRIPPKPEEKVVACHSGGGQAASRLHRGGCNQLVHIAEMDYSELEKRVAAWDASQARDFYDQWLRKPGVVSPLDFT